MPRMKVQMEPIDPEEVSKFYQDMLKGALEEFNFHRAVLWFYGDPEDELFRAERRPKGEPSTIDFEMDPDIIVIGSAKEMSSVAPGNP